MHGSSLCRHSERISYGVRTSGLEPALRARADLEQWSTIGPPPGLRMHLLALLLPVLLSQPAAFQATSAQSRGAPECREWAECQRLALEAADRHEYETFHD